MNSSARVFKEKGQLKKTSTPFGDVIQDQVGVLTTNDGVSSYTLGMKNLKSNNELSIDNLVITENQDGTLSSQILRYKPSEKWLQNRNVKGLNWDNYSGEIMIYDGRGKLKAVGEFLNGDATRKTTNKEMAGRNDEMDCVVTDVSVAGLEQNGEFYPTDIIIDYHCSSGGGAGGGSDHGLPNGGGEFPHNAAGAHGGGGGSSANNGSSDSSQIPTVIDDRLLHISFGENITRCVQSIIYKLQRKDMQNLTLPDIGQLAGTSHLSQIILDIFDGSDDFNLKFDVKEAGTNEAGIPVNADTQRDDTSVKPQWNITLDDDYVRNATDLAIARTIIHESIHAFIGYSLHRDKTSDMAYELNLLYHSRKINLNLNLTQHEFISQFVEALALSLSIWDNRQEPDSYYQKLAWAGLKKTDAYKSKADTTEIQKAILNEQLGRPNAKGINAKIKFYEVY